MEHESALPKGFRFDEYEIVRVLGAGGFGITYLGYDHHLDKPVAIKEFLPNDLAVRRGDTSVVAKSSGDQSDFEWGLTRFLEEARVLARFDHPNLPKVHRFFQAHGTGYIVMEYVEGKTLTEWLKQRGKLKEQAVKDIVLPLLDGLENVHQAGYLHRDIKPANIVIRDDGSPVLIDFGAARAALGVKSRSVTSIVTPGYAPIEQYSSRAEQGVWTDLYAMAAVMYKALSGKTPEDATDRVRNDPLKPAAEVAKGQASPTFLQAVDWALAVDEPQRPQTVHAWRQSLLGEAGEAYQSEPAQAASGGGKPRRPGQFEAVGLLAVMAIGVGLWLLQPPAKQPGEQAEAPSPSPSETESEVDESGTQNTDDPTQPRGVDRIPELVRIEGGCFQMGSPKSESNRDDDERPHRVCVENFSIGKYEVTQGQWEAVMGDNPSEFQGAERPVEQVSWHDVQDYIDQLNARTGKDYRLPTEAEWEYACRSGGQSQRYCGGDELEGVAWHRYNSDDKTHPIGRKQANGLGLYDMSGNVGEWTCSIYNENYEGQETRCASKTAGGARVLRGGSWIYKPWYVRSANRSRRDPDNRDNFVGFRLAQD